VPHPARAPRPAEVPVDLLAVDRGDDDSPENRDALAARCLDGLPASTVRLVEVGAIFGCSFSVADVAEILDQPVGALLAAVDAAVASGVLVLTADAAEFRHEAIREAIYERVPAALRPALHQEIGELLVKRRQWAAAANHLLEGGTVGDRAAIAALEEAADGIAASTPSRSCELALRALSLTDPCDVTRFARAAAAVETLVAAGRLQEAEHLARQVLGSHSVPASAAARLRLVLAHLALTTAGPQQAITELDSVITDPDVPDALHATAERCHLWSALAREDVPGATRKAEEILSGGASRDVVLPDALAAWACLAWRDGCIDRALGLARAAVARGRLPEPGTASPFGRLCLTSMLAALGDITGAMALVDSTNDEITAAGDTIWAAAPVVASAEVHLAAGRLDAAKVSARAAVDLAARLGTPAFAYVAEAVLAEVALMRGELADAATHVNESDPGVSSAWPPWGGPRRRLAAARLADVEADPGTVPARVADVYAGVADNASLLLDDPAAAPWLARVALAAGAREQAEMVVARAERLADANSSFPTIVAAAWHAAGLLRLDPQLVQDAGERQVQPRACASAWEDAGVLLIARDRRAAQVSLERAVAAYAQIGAQRDVARVRSRLRAIGVHWQHGRRAHRGVSGWASLTKTEHVVSEFVAQGLTNAQVADRLYLSRHTVDFHLRQIFRKLGIDSRVALARLLPEPADGPRASPSAQGVGRSKAPRGSARTA
jgi:DNA-binding CsgD family transcriptional regulator